MEETQKKTLNPKPFLVTDVIAKLDPQIWSWLVSELTLNHVIQLNMCITILWKVVKFIQTLTRFACTLLILPMSGG